MKEKTISEILREYIETNNISERKLAEKIGISKDTVRKIFNGSTSIQNETIVKIANYLGYDVKELGGVRKPIKKECGILPTSIQVDKNEAIKAAEDFNYGKDVYEALENAKTLGEINRIMATARHKKFG